MDCERSNDKDGRLREKIKWILKKNSEEYR